MEKALVCMNIWERQFWSIPQDRVEIFETRNPNKTIIQVLKKYPRIVALLVNEINWRNWEHFELVRGWWLHEKDVIWTPNSDLLLPDVIKSSNAVWIEWERLEEVIKTLKWRIANKLTTWYSWRFVDWHCSETFTNMARLDTDFRV